MGNIAGAIVTSTSKTTLPSMPGTAGHQLSALRTFVHPLPPGSVLVMHSDALSERWRPQEVAGVLRHCPAVIAGRLMRSVGKYHDDASVIVAKGLW